MYKKNELCRNFQRGSCQYGARCKFLHHQQQQQQQQQQQKQQQQQPSSNPFGFGVPSNNKQSKPFENKWSRFSNAAGAATAGTATASAAPPQSRQSDNHSCNNPDACKRLIVQDFEQEQPSWKLTCYGHLKNGPCDIIGDISYEELRAVAYDDAKRGLSLQSIVERERSLLSSKLVDVQNLLRNPYVVPSKSSSSLSPFPGVSSNAASSTVQNSSPPSVSTFGELGAMGFGTRPAAPTNNALIQPNLVPNSSQTLNAHGLRPSAPSNNIFGQSNMFSNFGQSSSTVGMNLPSINAGSIGSQPPNHTFGRSTSFVAPGVGSSGISNQNNSVLPAFSMHNAHSSSVSGPNSVSSTIGQATTNFSSPVKRENVSGAESIWLKEKWMPGEIPEEAPPNEFVF